VPKHYVYGVVNSILHNELNAMPPENTPVTYVLWNELLNTPVYVIRRYIM
jgi:hypothetical protein